MPRSCSRSRTPTFLDHARDCELFSSAQRVAQNVGLGLAEGQYGGDSDGNFTGTLGIPTIDGLGVCVDGVRTKAEYIKISSIKPRARLLAGLFKALSDKNRCHRTPKEMIS